MNVSFLYVNISALCLYTIMLFAFLSAKKTPEIRSFITVLAGFIVWTGGSILMRLQVFPGVDFWFYVSIMGLFSCGLLIYLFICSFTHAKGYALKIFWSVTTVVLLVLTALGVFLKPPEVGTLSDGSTVFRYTIEWQIAIPCVYFAFLIGAMVLLFRNYIKEKGIHSPGVMAIIAGCVAIAVGNVVQLIPGNVFPWDTLSGAVFAVMLMIALYCKRMFRMTLIISRSALMVVYCVLCIASASYFVSPLMHWLMANTFLTTAEMATSAIVVVFTILLAAMYAALKKLMDALFTREEQQGRLLKSFSKHISQTLNTEAVMAELVQVIQEELSTDRIYVLLPEGNKFVAKYSPNPLDSLSFSIALDNPCVNYLCSEENYFIVSDFQNTPLYLSMWKSEKELLQLLDIGCVFALKDSDEIVGIIFLANKEKKGSYSYVEISFLQTVSSIASIALKNAALYEQVYQEARIDSLTGVYNYKYFVEKTSEAFEQYGRECLSLMYFDLDDFKLFNQLYGTANGDAALKAVADTMVRLTGSNGTVFRNSGKVFAVLLPGMDARETETLAREIRKQILKINVDPSHITNPMSVSCGICVAPYAAASARELIENADLAVYNAKCTGKGRTVLFRPQLPTDSLSVAEHSAQIVERGGHSGSSNYETFSQTVYALTAAIDAKDRYTFNHSENVARYASVLATAAKLSDHQVRVIYEAGLLHDIGKISIPESILSKPGALTDGEFEIMKTHVDNSIEMIRHLPSMDYVIPAAVAHHERWDGKGYPRGIAGEEIPVAGRCLAVADSFDAMTTNRPYRKSLSVEFAVDQLLKGAGTQFDPVLAELFVRLIQDGEIEVPSQMKNQEQAL